MPDTTTDARSLAEKFKALGDRLAAQPAAPPPKRKPRRRVSPPRERSTDQASPTALFDGPFAAAKSGELAELLDDYESVRYYRKLVDDIRHGRKFNTLPRHEAFALVTRKAKELSRLASAEAGIIRNPAAAFVAWVGRTG